MSTEWLSIRGARAPWDVQNIRPVAQALVDSLPAAALAILSSPGWKAKGGVPLPIFRDEISWTICRADVSRYYTFVYTMLTFEPNIVPIWLLDR